MEELDLLKKDWKRSENRFNQVSENEIYTMLHRKSSSIVKWILIVSIIELVVWSALSLLGNMDDFLKKINHEELIMYFKLFSIFHYVVIAVLIYLFYRNYVNISTTSSTRDLMKSIIQTRKTVQFYVWYNLVMIAVSFIIGFVINLVYNPEMDALLDKINTDGSYMAGVLIGLGLCVFVFVGLFWLVYRVIYGVLLRRLLANYKELRKIEL